MKKTLNEEAFQVNSKREKLAANVSWMGIIINTALAFLKLVISFITGSMAILADGIDSTTDIITSILTLIASKISSKPADESHPFGHERAETIVTKVLSLVIIYAGFQVLTGSIQSIINHNFLIHRPYLVLWISLISIVTKYFLYKYKFSVGNKIRNSSLVADALNMKNDILTSLSVFIGIIFYLTLNIMWVDSLVAIIVSVFIFRVGIKMFLETSDEFMGSSKELGEIYYNTLEAVEKIGKAYNPHKIRVRKAGYVYFVELHIEVDEDMTIKEANEIASQVERELKKINPYIKDVIIHVEPLGNIEEEEFGFDKNSIKRIFDK
ncbi:MULTISPECIES: cation diffusion facilitator family transporter [Petrotoga]|uniref:Cation diffusion facilitator family transporter n=2 Tax=Petrotoga sibirica TaxID=156202 RepID=A0A4R8EXP6_9BACT|nr:MULTISPECIES: cation diffusion facilitator family transporter [Petrotoga]POZ88855.1 cation transporter [Petrotoga sibirica DSM 13575]POZ90973.1 cation transporter [Petrotoga sp. SL27]TDX17482.1 cation diffusion facilitator family transporter [Petrotoga sibirica]